MADKNISLELAGELGRIDGFCDSRFEPVLGQFVENYKSRGEQGASLTVTHEGKTVIDVWGGIAFGPTNRAWTEDTVCNVFSSTKGVTAIIANMLIDQGLLDPAQPVAEIWPEFATNGKEKATVRMMMDHTVGVPALRETVKPGGYKDWDYMCGLLAAQEPYWEPGSNQGYHAVTFGWTVGELIRRITKKSVGQNIQEMLSVPLGLDLWCGLPEEIEPRVAPMIPHIPQPGEELNPLTAKVAVDPGSIPGVVMMNDGGFMSGEGDNPQTHYIAVDDRSYHESEIPSANGITNARGLAGVYMPFALGGTVDGKRFVGPETMVGMEECSARTNRDEILMAPSGFSLGFMKSIDVRHVGPADDNGVLIGRRAFGHAGAGGSLGFADPEAGLSFGYAMTKMGGTLGMTTRGQSLIDAVYRALGYRNSDTGFWVK